MNELVKHSILPPDFRLQVIIHEDGTAETIKMGLEAAMRRSYSYDAKFFNRLVTELRALFAEQYCLNQGDIITLSSYDNVTGAQVCWLRSKVPVNRDRRLPEPKKTLHIQESSGVIDV